MPNVTRSLFISYRGSDAFKVDKITHDLALLRFDDGTPRFSIWQDKYKLPPTSPNWWDAIVDAINACEVFVFNLSRASLESEVCRAELDYAHKCNRPIVPLVLRDEFFLRSFFPRHYELPQETQELVPDWLEQTQFLFYTGAAFYKPFQTAIELFERNRLLDTPAARPLNPSSKSVQGSNQSVYTAACDYAYRLAFADAEKHFDVLVQRNHVYYVNLATLWLKWLRLYAELIELFEQHCPHEVFKQKWGMYAARFPNGVIARTFDPKGLVTHVVTPIALPSVSSQSVPTSPLEAALERARIFGGTRNTDWTPYIAKLSEIDPSTPLPNLEMCLVPVGKFLMG